MAAAPLTDRRSIRAAGIVQAGDIHESKPGVWRVRDKAGSGTWHYVSGNSCDCIDFQRSGHGLECKHLRAVKQHQAANWSAQAESFLESIDTLLFDEDGGLAAPARGVWYKGEYLSPEHLARAAEARVATPVCPTCQSPTAEDLRWCGRSGWLRFRCCMANREHRAVRV